MEHKKISYNRTDPIRYEDDEDSTAQDGGFLSPERHLGQLALVEAPVAELSFEDQLIRDDAILVVTDFLEATKGTNMEPGHYLRLLAANWAQFGIEDIYRLFNGSWHELLAEARKKYEEERAHPGKGPTTKEHKKHLEQILEASKELVYSPHELMDRLPENADFNKLPTYYFDPSTNRIIEGEESVNLLALKGIDISSFKNLGELLRDEAFFSAEAIGTEVDTRSWDIEKCLKYGKWLINILPPPPTPAEKFLNEDIMQHAHLLNIAPGPWIIRDRTTSLANFYTIIGAAETHRVGTFEHWTRQDFVDYLKNLGTELERRPTKTDLNKLARQNPQNPSHELIYKRYKGRGGFTELVEEAGYPDIRSWEKKDFIDWGVKFMQANNGLLPTARAINFLSARDLGPSVFPIQRKFGLPNYHKELVKSYHKPRVREDCNAPTMPQPNPLTLGLDYDKHCESLQAKRKSRQKQKEI